MGQSRFLKSRRNAARFSLYASLLVVTGLSLSVFPLARGVTADIDQSWADYDYESDPRVEFLRELVRIDTTSDRGREIDAARLIAARLEADGVPVVVEELIDGKTNLWAILEGRSPEALVLHSHLDTDPIAKPDEWEHPPFAAHIDAPWLFGRGVFDMKSYTAAHVETLLHLKRRMDEDGFVPERSLILLATSSEETGSDLGVKWILRHHKELAERFWVVLTEGGVLEATDRNTIKYWGTSFVQKRYIEVTACSLSAERLRLLQQDIIAYRDEAGPTYLSEPILQFLDVYGITRENPAFAWPLRNPELVLSDPLYFPGFPPYLKALFRNEAHPFHVVKDPEGVGYQLRILVHLLPGVAVEEGFAEALPEWLTHGVELDIYDVGASAEMSSLDHPAFLTINGAIEELRSPEAAGPYALSFFANDSRFFRAAGITSYGFTPFVFFSIDTMSVGGPNERIALPAFLEGLELHDEIVTRLLSLPS